MSNRLANIPARLLLQAAALTLAGLLAACGGSDGGHHHHNYPPPPPPPPKPIGLTYNVIPLSLGGVGTQRLLWGAKASPPTARSPARSTWLGRQLARIPVRRRPK